MTAEQLRQLAQQCREKAAEISASKAQRCADYFAAKVACDILLEKLYGKQ